MDKESIQALRFDRRLGTRKGHVDPAELEKYLASLPDVGEKVQQSQEEEKDSAPQAPADAPPGPFSSTE